MNPSETKMEVSKSSEEEEKRKRKAPEESKEQKRRRKEEVENPSQKKRRKASSEEDSDGLEMEKVTKKPRRNEDHVPDSEGKKRIALRLYLHSAAISSHHPENATNFVDFDENENSQGVLESIHGEDRYGINLDGNQVMTGDRFLLAFHSKCTPIENWVEEGNVPRWVDTHLQAPSQAASEFLIAAGNFFRKPKMILVSERGYERFGDRYSPDITVTIRTSGPEHHISWDQMVALQIRDLRDARDILFGTVFPPVSRERTPIPQDSKLLSLSALKHLATQYSLTSVPETKYPRDLLHLYEQMAPPPKTVLQGMTEDQKEAVANDLLRRLRALGTSFADHVGLWSSQRRTNFVHNVMHHIKIATIPQHLDDDGTLPNNHGYTDIQIELNLMPLSQGTNKWTQVANTDEVMREVLVWKQGEEDEKKKKKTRGKPKRTAYDDSGSEFHRFTVNFSKHSRDWKPEKGEDVPDGDDKGKAVLDGDIPKKRERAYTSENGPWLDYFEYPELKLTEMFPTYMIEIVDQLRNLPYSIES